MDKLKGLDYDLRNKTYWQKVIDQADTKCGYSESKTNTLTCKDLSVKTNPSKQDLTLILSELFVWRYAWVYNDFALYMKFYDSLFQRFDGMKYEEFKQVKAQIFSKNERKHIFFSDIVVVPVKDEKKNLFEVTFEEKYQASSHSFTGAKKLLIQVSANQMKILKEL